MISLLALALASLSDEPDLIIRNAKVVDVDAGTHQLAHVAIDDGKIVSVGSELPTAGADTQILEAGGRYLIPGLWDTHVHSAGQWSWHAPVMLAHGITSVRNLHTTDPDGYATIRAIKEQAARGEVPRMIANGFIVGGTNGWPQTIPIVDSVSAKAAVDAHVENGMDFIKVYHDATPEAYHALMGYAEAAGLPVDGHLPMNMRTQKAVVAGQRTIEHSIAMSNGCSDWDEADHIAKTISIPESLPEGDAGFLLMIRSNEEARVPSECAELAEMMAEHGTVVVPTMINGISMGDGLATMSVPGVKEALPASIYSRWMEMAKSPRGRAAAELRGPAMKYETEAMTHYRNAGVTVLAGTDIGNPFLAPGATLLAELELLVDAGMTAREALAAATTQPPNVFEIEGLGCIAAGCTADLVLLDHDPLVRISNVRSTAGVVLAGRYHPKGDLDAAAAAALAAYDADAE